MPALLLRHGHALPRGGWHDDDRLRPLNDRGLAEADELVAMLRPFGPVRIVSSPLLRCRQTVAPLADAVDVTVESASWLAPLAAVSAATVVRRMAIDLSDPVVFCTHGEVIEALQVHVGQETPAVFGPKSPREKASVWVLDWSDGRFVAARYLPPPRVGRQRRAVE